MAMKTAVNGLMAFFSYLFFIDKGGTISGIISYSTLSGVIFGRGLKNFTYIYIDRIGLDSIG